MSGVRPHGRAKYVVEQCHCDRCRRSMREYERWRVRQRAYGRAAYVDAEPARRHVRTMMAAGMGLGQVARVSEVPYGTLSALLYGDATRGLSPSRRIRPGTARALLAVEVSLDTMARGATMDGTGTRRRLQALVTIGWPQTALAGQLGMDQSNITRLIRSERSVAVSTALRVRALYDRLWDTPPPQDSCSEKIAASRSRRMARQRGWVPPMAWDDEQLDDPAAAPDPGTEPQRAVGAQPKLPPADELRFLTSCGESIAGLATRFGVSETTVRRTLKHSHPSDRRQSTTALEGSV